MRNLDKQPLNVEEQENLMSSFWTMLKELEGACEEGDIVLRHFVNKWHDQWNELNHDNKTPRWARKD